MAHHYRFAVLPNPIARLRGIDSTHLVPGLPDSIESDGATVNVLHHRKGTRGFTVIELLVVIGVAVAIMGASIPAYQYVRRQAAIDSTGTLVRAVATAIDAYGQRLRPVYGPSPTDPTVRVLVANLPMWDVDKNGILDDSLGVDRDAALGSLPGNTQVANLDMQGYAGFARSGAASVPDEAFDQATGRVVDKWGTPLRFRAGVTAAGVTSAARTYGGSWFGVWSCGPNTVDNGGEGDDVCSWK